jgi:glycosyltransferase involved in cell wall biosynthesis
METPFISYLVTCHNEGFDIQHLLERLYKYSDGNECIILDDYSDDKDTIGILQNAVKHSNGFFQLHQHKLDNSYSEHKNYGKSLCKGEYIFQIDADELPSETLLQSLKELIELNKNIDLFWIPRINDFRGVDDIEAKKWGWRLTKIPELVKEKIIDDQSYEYKFLKNNGYILEETKIS